MSYSKRKEAPTETQEFTVDLIEKCPSCHGTDVLRVNLLVGTGQCKPSHRWCSGYSCTYTKDLLSGK